MPNSTERPTLQTSLLQRYRDQHAGGAYNAKTIVTNGQYSPLENSTLSVLHTNRGFKTRIRELQTELNEAKGNSSLESSIYIKGFDNVRYGDTVNARGK